MKYKTWNITCDATCLLHFAAKTDEMNADALIAGVLGNECTIFS